MDVSDAAAAWRRDGFVVLPGYLDGPELQAAQRDLPAVYPTADDFHAAPGEGRNRVYTGDEFGGIAVFLFPTVALCNLVVHDKLIALAEAVFETTEIRIYASELWLSDVSEEHGPTRVVPLPATAGVPALPHGYHRSERPDFYESEKSAAGTVVAYSTDTFHRGTAITAPHSARFSAHVSYKHAGNLWTGRHAWGDHSFHPDWNPFVEQATMRQLLLFGFPPPGHPYWTPQTLQDLSVRYPGLDTRQWQQNEQQIL